MLEEDLERNFRVVTALLGSTAADEVAIRTLFAQKLQQQLAALCPEKGGSGDDSISTIIDPLHATIGPGFRFGGKYIVKKRLSDTKPIYLCEDVLLRDRHDRIQREVVIKCTPHLTNMNPATVAMIKEQQKRALQVIGVDASTCPHSVALFDAGELMTPDGTVVLYWEAFERMKCDADQLRTTMGGTLPPLIIMRLAYQIAEALLHYHTLEIIHRDIKPHNLLCNWPGHELFTEIWKLLINFKLTDAQLVTGTAVDTSVTQAGMILGTPQYMSPEQIADSRNVTTYSDIWSFAVTLHELITGELPHPPITSMADLHVILNGQPKLFSAHPKAIDYPQWFQRLMDQSLNRDPKARPSSYHWYVAFRTQDTRMPLVFEPLPFFLLPHTEVLPP